MKDWHLARYPATDTIYPGRDFEARPPAGAVFSERGQCAGRQAAICCTEDHTRAERCIGGDRRDRTSIESLFTTAINSFMIAVRG